jgi:ADP-ribose pyrophosphatase YjhB (NUDIX family)
MTRTAPESRDYPARPILCASAAVFRDGRVLLGARRQPPYDQIFSLPGGLVETGETLEAAALRELAEETGVRGEILAFNGWREVINHDGAGRVLRHYVIASFVARWLAGEGEPGEELGRLVWADAAQAAALPLTPGLPDLLARAWRLAGEAHGEAHGKSHGESSADAPA